MNRKTYTKYPNLPIKLRHFNTRDVELCKTLKQPEKDILLYYNIIAYELNFINRHAYWLKNFMACNTPNPYYREGASGARTITTFNLRPEIDRTEWEQMCDIEKTLENEFQNLKYGNDNNQGNYCVSYDCACFVHREYYNKKQQKTTMVLDWDEKLCKQWVSLRWCPLLKDCENDTKQKLHKVYNMLKLEL